MPTRPKPTIRREDVFIPDEVDHMGWIVEAAGNGRLPFYALVNSPYATVFRTADLSPTGATVRDLVTTEGGAG